MSGGFQEIAERALFFVLEIIQNIVNVLVQHRDPIGEDSIKLIIIVINALIDKALKADLKLHAIMRKVKDPHAVLKCQGGLIIVLFSIRDLAAVQPFVDLDPSERRKIFRH